MTDYLQALTERANFYRDPATCGYWQADSDGRLTRDALRKAAFELGRRADLLTAKAAAIRQLVAEIEAEVAT